MTPKHVRHLLQNDNQEYLQFKRVLDILGDKWSALIIMCILDQPRRFVDIQEFAAGISPRTLSQRLHMLEEFGLITRKEYKEFPPRTEYSVTDKARELKAAMSELKKWAKKYCKNSSA
jgi:DNA-binding HxlR family transcriptional regulator